MFWEELPSNGFAPITVSVVSGLFFVINSFLGEVLSKMVALGLENKLVIFAAQD